RQRPGEVLERRPRGLGQRPGIWAGRHEQQLGRPLSGDQCSGRDLSDRHPRGLELGPERDQRLADRDGHLPGQRDPPPAQELLAQHRHLARQATAQYDRPLVPTRRIREEGDTTMLSYAHGACDEPLLGETIGANLDRTIARVPDADALVSRHQGVRYTYAELGQAVDRLAGGLLAAGLGSGDRVGVWGPNRAEWALVQYATAKLGVILVNINPAYRT